MNSLGRYLNDQIRIHGPLSIAGYMATALGHPQWGYYTSRDPLGRSGDFTTAPEISQMFGELIGLWCADRWRSMGAPRQFILAELGPGRGTLIADALRAAAALPGFNDAAEVHLVETSAVLRAAQEMSLEGQRASWHERVEDLPEGPVIAVANEFFDALPIRQFQATEDGWHERLVDSDETGFHLVLSPQATPSAVIPHAALGDIFEISPPRDATISELSRRIADRGGAALIIDYGHEVSSMGDTLQAMHGHKYTNPLQNPGDADLTAHVDFQALRQAVESTGAVSHGPVIQGSFLRQLGITLRADRLRAGATTAQITDIDSAMLRLTAKDQMGELFKVLAVTRPGDPAPPGFGKN